MNRQTVFRRTAEGQDEIKTRQRGLEHNHRFALIMIDGASNVAELEAKSAGRWDTESLLRDLWDQGLIEPVARKEGMSEHEVASQPVPEATSHGGETRAAETGPDGEGLEPQADETASPPTSEAVKELLGESIKGQMVAVVKAIMGEHGGEKLIAKIQASEESPTALADAVDSGCIFIKLTVSESKAQALKERLHEILSEKYDRPFFKGFFRK